ncbi:MAG: protein adenylyltransferase SelO family protein, partial [Gammaproteobacteria bacterium]|nr:protein adenylyltransferase SelO family protein [Gammaproteobacteria bacterium]
KTSGDGRSIWNGYFKGRNAWWDVSSCGTGATCLSPATAIEGRFFKTGAKDVSYGTGLADLDGGISSALMSDIFHRNGIATERNLCVIAYPDRSAVIVRAGKNLLRPAHLFLWLKQNRHHELKAAVDYYIERQVKNKEFPNFEHAHQAYDHLTQFICEKFAKAAAFFEMEYIFCWMDWDGDNILSDAGIIDYGSVRQFGLFHSEYRYDDVDKYSTSINEQRKHARYTVQTYLQIVEFIKTGHKSNIKLFNHHETLVKFDQIFEQHKDYMLLYKMGFEPKLIEYFLADDIRVEWAREFRQVYRYFEKAKAKRGKYRINDGITWDAIFCLRDMLRELPKRYLNGEHMLSHKDFIEILLSDYASNRDIAHYRKRKEKTRQFQTLYWQIVSIAADLLNKEEKAVLIAMSKRSELINRHDRITGDGLIHATERLMRSQKNLSNKELHNLFLDFVEQQVLVPEYFKKVDPHQHVRSTAAKKVLQGMLKVVKSHREGI